MSPVFERLKQASGAMVHFVGGRISKADVADPAGLRNGDGALVQMDGRKLAVYRDEEGKLHAMSPICRHMKCIVDWNAADRTWDCPCHGSRYDAYGHVIQSPAKKNLIHESLD